MGPDNREVSMATVFEIERLAKLHLPLPEISRRLSLPNWRVYRVCEDARIPVRP